jgi:MerR family transcriptional regulator/heat shock protein HspR
MARGSNRRSGDAAFPEDRGVFMISVAAGLAGMHPQTLRIYEERGLIKPARSPKQTRLYSRRDVERLKRIQQLTTDFGLNLAGVERVLALEEVMQSMQDRLDRLASRAAEMEREMLQRIDEVHRSYKRELVPWQPPGAALGTRIPVERKASPARSPSDGLPADGSRSRRSKPEAGAGGVDAT